MGQEPDRELHNRYRWVIPVEDPCQCTEIQLGGMTTRAPCRPFKVTYYDTFLLSTNPQEIQQWLKCNGKWNGMWRHAGFKEFLLTEIEAW